MGQTTTGISNVSIAHYHNLNTTSQIYRLLYFRISSSQTSFTEAGRVEQEELDIKCLQILRAVIHNEIVRLADDWELNIKKNKRYVRFR